MRLQIFTPTEFYGTVMELVIKRHGVYKDQDYPAPNRVQLNFEIALGELIIDFFDELKSTDAWLCLDGLPRIGISSRFTGETGSV